MINEFKQKDAELGIETQGVPPQYHQLQDTHLEQTGKLYCFTSKYYDTTNTIYIWNPTKIKRKRLFEINFKIFGSVMLYPKKITMLSNNMKNIMLVDTVKINQDYYNRCCWDNISGEHKRDLHKANKRNSQSTALLDIFIISPCYTQHDDSSYDHFEH